MESRRGLGDVRGAQDGAGAVGQQHAQVGITPL
jgi:hypothetical protein